MPSTPPVTTQDHPVLRDAPESERVMSALSAQNAVEWLYNSIPGHLRGHSVKIVRDNLFRFISEMQTCPRCKSKSPQRTLPGVSA